MPEKDAFELRPEFFLRFKYLLCHKNYMTSEGALSHNVLYFQQLLTTKLVFMAIILSKCQTYPLPLSYATLLAFTVAQICAYWARIQHVFTHVLHTNCTHGSRKA